MLRSRLSMVNKFIPKITSFFRKIRNVRRQTIKSIAPFAIGSLFIIGPITYLLVTNAVRAEAWWNDEWAYRVRVPVTNNTTAQTNVYIAFKSTTTYINTSDTNKFQSDCGDLRFTDSKGVLLPYHIVSGCGTANTEVRVNFGSFASGAQSIYYYYGNSVAVNGFEAGSFTTEASNYTIGTFNSEEKGTYPSSYWAFNEGYGTTTKDSSVNNNTASLGGTVSAGTGITSGTATAPTWRTNEYCISGRCLYFDGDANAAIVNQAHSVDLGGRLSEGFTFVFWMKANSTGEGGSGNVFNKGADTYVKTVAGSNNNVANMQVSVGLSTSNATITINDAVELNKWHHVAIGYTNDSDDEISVYIDGKLMGQSTNGSGNPLTNPNPLLIGGTFANNFKGFIDEFKIYSYERSADQIRSNAVAGSGAKGLSVSVGMPGASQHLANGLVAYWKMEETSTSSLDSSGNGHTATWSGNATSALGKFGNATSWDGVGDYLNAGTSPSLHNLGPLTYSAWINPTNVGQNSRGRIIQSAPDGTGPRMLYLCSACTGQLVFYVDFDGTDLQAETYTNVIPYGAYSHVTVTWDGTTNASGVKFYINGVEVPKLISDSAVGNPVADTGQSFYIGNRPGTPDRSFNGTMDEVRVYNRELSPTEIKTLYEWAPAPIAYYDMEEGTGQNVYNKGTGGNHGTLGANTSVGSDDPVWVTGKFGKALKFDGTNDFVNLGNVFRFTSSFSVSAWVNRLDNDCYNYIVNKTGASGARDWYLSVCESNPIINIAPTSSTAFQRWGGEVIQQGKWHHIAGVYDAPAQKLMVYVDGQLANYETGTAPSSIYASNNNVYIGGRASDSSYANAIIDEVRVYNYPRSAQQIVEDMNAGHPAPGSPVGSALSHWKFDEQQGQTINNTAPNTITATRGATSGSESSDPTWKTSALCKLNGCLDFDGSDDVITITNTSSIDLNDNLASGLTFSAWINPDTVGESSAGRIFEKSATTYCQIGGTSPFNITCSLDLDTDATITVNSVIPASTYTHVALAWTDDADDELTLYINGVAKGTSTNGVGPTSAESSNLLVGGGTSNNFDGRIDEFKIYSSELTVEQIGLDMNAGVAVGLGGVFGNAEATNILDGAGSAPVAYWDFEEKTGVYLIDKSGNDITGTLGGDGTGTDVPAWKGSGDCKVGNCLEFDGGDYVAVPDIDTLDFGTSTNFSVSFWTKLTNDGNTDILVGKYKSEGSNSDGGWHIRYNAATSRLWAEITPNSWTNYCTIQGSTDVANGQWQHVQAVFNRNASCTTNDIILYVNGVRESSTVQFNTANANSNVSNDDALNIGARDAGTMGNFLRGSLDDLKIYNYARTPAQVAYDYNRGGPVAHWKFDECNGTAVSDQSGNNLNGTISYGTVGNTSAGQCGSGIATEMWNDGTVGKHNGSLGFDGTDDYVTIPYNAKLGVTADFTFSAWLKSPDAAPQCPIITRTDSNNYWDYEFGIGDNASTYDGIMYLYVDQPGYAVRRGNTALTNDTWHHVAVTRSGSTVSFYLDGVYDGGGTLTGALGNHNVPVYIGSSYLNFAQYHCEGLIDDARIYNYSLSPAQIKTIMNFGGIRFGPK